LSASDEHFVLKRTEKSFSWLEEARADWESVKEVSEIFVCLFVFCTSRMLLWLLIYMVGPGRFWILRIWQFQV
jgi:hypothetical protein